MVYHTRNLRLYVSALEEECRKIQVFRNELPHCYELVKRTIEEFKQKIDEDRVVESNQALSDVQTGLEELILLKGDDNSEKEKRGEQKSECIRYDQVWNPIPDLNFPEDDDKENDGRSVLPVDRPVPQEKDDRNVLGKLTLPPAESSPFGGGEQKQRAVNYKRKHRRRWSSELHRRFLIALENLGVATPKQVKQRMKVDGLTSDEIKSHLQKHRLHSKLEPRTTQPLHTKLDPISLPRTAASAPVATTIPKTYPSLSSSSQTITITSPCLFSSPNNVT